MSSQHSSGEMGPAGRARELSASLFILEEMGKGGRNEDQQPVFIMEATSHGSPRELCKTQILGNYLGARGVRAMTAPANGAGSARMGRTSAGATAAHKPHKIQCLRHKELNSRSCTGEKTPRPPHRTPSSGLSTAGQEGVPGGEEAALDTATGKSRGRGFCQRNRTS